MVSICPVHGYPPAAFTRVIRCNQGAAQGQTLTPSRKDMSGLRFRAFTDRRKRLRGYAMSQGKTLTVTLGRSARDGRKIRNNRQGLPGYPMSPGFSVHFGVDVEPGLC